MLVLLFLIFCIVTGPGIYIGTNLITPTDIAIPLLSFFICKKKMIVYKIQKRMIVYVFSIAISLMIGIVFDNGIGVGSFLKAIRVFYVMLIPSIVGKCLDRYQISEETMIKETLVLGSISGIIGIMLFYAQSTIYQAPEMFIFFGKYIHRAGGVFAEANYFGIMMAILIAVAFECIVKKFQIFLSIITICVCGLGLVFSDSRTALLSLIIVVLTKFSNIKKKENFFALFKGLSIAWLLYLFVPYVNAFINNRIISAFIGYKNGVDINSISSGRIDNWVSSIKSFGNNSILEIIFGTGYKSETTNVLMDNSYVSTVMTLGLFGVVAFLILWGYLIECFGKESKELIVLAYKDVVVIFLVSMLFLDTMTMSRCVYLLVLFYTFGWKIKKNGENYE